MSKVGRNDPCPCGSGKKYKKCCLKKESAGAPATAAAAVKEANVNARLMAQRWMGALGGDSTPPSGSEFKLILDEFQLTDRNAVERVRALGKAGENGEVLFYEGKQWIGEAVFPDDLVLALTTADVKMANKLKGKLEKLSGVTHRSRKEDVLEAGDVEAAGASAGADMLSFKVGFFKTWPDEANERLEGLAPREAVKNPRLRKELLKLLGELEAAESRLPKKERYSFKGVRKELGL